VTAADGFVTDARRVADAILYEGYLLYPYRGSSGKNQSRFQFGVLMPPAYRGVDASERSVSQTECLLEAPEDAGVTVIARFLHLQRRQVEAADGAGGFRPVASVQVDDAEVTTWDEAAEREHRAAVPLAALLAGGVDAAFEVPGGESVETLTDSATEPVPGTRSANKSFDSVRLSPLAIGLTVRRASTCVAGLTFVG